MFATYEIDTMTYSKVINFDLQSQEISQLAKVLSHPARIAILKFLAKSKTCISGDICNEIPLSRTTVSQHLQELKKAGLIHGEIEGIKINYCLCQSNIKKCYMLFNELFDELDVEINCEDNC
ncbi:MAG: metalloregulator ArsR/SmtB family transcription factor [Bacteroidales bacterium]|nr:metalloregulator ArsR/SmtB family transcription factor [Bacteroidales bacterium]